jgi:hypothetical protein
MQRLAGIKTNLNESIGGYRDIQPLREMDDETKKKLPSKFDKYDLAKQSALDNSGNREPDKNGDCPPGMQFDREWRMCVDSFREEKDKNCPGCKRMKEEEEGDEQNAAFNDFYNKVKGDGGMGEASVEDIAAAMDQAVAFAKKLAQQIANKKGGSLTQKDFFRLIDNFRSKVKDVGPFKSLDGSEDLEEGDSMTGEEGWEANTVADYFSNSEENTKEIAKQIDFLLRENYQDDVDDIVDLIIELAQDYADERINNPDPTFDEAKNKGGEDGEKKEKDYKGMNMSKKDVMDKMGKGKTNTVKGDRAKAYVPPHARANESLSESKVKPNKDFIW